MNDSERMHAGQAAGSETPVAFEPVKGHWYVARSFVKWPRQGRRGRHLYDERLVLIDAPSPRKALAVAEKEARSTVDGQKSLGVVELGYTDQRLVHGGEIHRSQYRTREKARKFVGRRFESGVWHAIRSTAEEAAPAARAGHEAPSDHETPSETEMPDEWGLSDWCVVRSIYTTGRLGSGRRRYHHWTERFVLFNTDDLHAANEMATVESEAFAGATGLSVCPLWEAYWLFSEPGHKIEVFSILRESKLRSRDFVSGVWGGGSCAGRAKYD